MKNKKPLEFFTDLLEPTLFMEFENYIIKQICEPGFFRTMQDGQREEFHAVVVTFYDKFTQQEKEVLLSSAQVMENEILKAKNRLLADIDNEIIAKGDLKYKEAVITTYQTAISFILNRLGTANHLDHYPFIPNTMRLIETDINVKYSNNIGAIAPKIQWLGKLNQLTTLIYELWQGQDKPQKAPSTKPLLKAQKKDLEDLLLDNFLDANGKPLSRQTITDYLNSSKPGTRAKVGSRIELDY